VTGVCWSRPGFRRLQ